MQGCSSRSWPFNVPSIFPSIALCLSKFQLAVKMAESAALRPSCSPSVADPDQSQLNSQTAILKQTIAALRDELALEHNGKKKKAR